MILQIPNSRLWLGNSPSSRWLGPGFFCGPWPKMKRLPRWGPARPAASSSRPLASIPTQTYQKLHFLRCCHPTYNHLRDVWVCPKIARHVTLFSGWDTRWSKVFYIDTTSPENRETGSARCITSVSDYQKCIPWSDSFEGGLEGFGGSHPEVLPAENAQKSSKNPWKTQGFYVWLQSLQDQAKGIRILSWREMAGAKDEFHCP